MAVVDPEPRLPRVPRRDRGGAAAALGRGPRRHGGPAEAHGDGGLGHGAPRPQGGPAGGRREPGAARGGPNRGVTWRESAAEGADGHELGQRSHGGPVRAPADPRGGKVCLRRVPASASTSKARAQAGVPERRGCLALHLGRTGSPGRQRSLPALHRTVCGAHRGTSAGARQGGGALGTSGSCLAAPAEHRNHRARASRS
mmetsp:Transcript_89971/g.268415  ORF Transcript_89971/g.268415 Transcript_89971/m.268415 type:complete len:200 (+) Transcript_89971:1322-1921(+)